MAAVKSPVSLAARAAMVFLLMTLVAQSEMAATAQNCSAGLGDLMQCGPYVLPGSSSGPPSQQCCNALRGVDHNCLCQTLDIISQLPTSCKLPPVTCSRA